MKKYFGLLVIALSVSIVSCDKDDSNGGSEGELVYGCTDENALNYNASATNDDGSCTYSNDFIINGDWEITHLEYSTEVEVPILGTVPVAGEAEDAGFYQIDAITHTYVGNVDFMTEPMNIGGFDVPSMPVQIPSEGTWAFANDDTELHFTSTEGVLQVYEVENLTADFALLRGYVTFPFDFPGIGAMDLDIELELQLEK